LRGFRSEIKNNKERVSMERQRDEHEVVRSLEAAHEWSRLVLKLRWVGMEDEARRLQVMMSTVPAGERGSVLAGPFSTD